MKSTFRYSTLFPVILASLGVFVFRSAQANETYIGNSLSVPNGNSDGIAPFVILGEYNPASPLGGSDVSLPAGNVTDVKFYGGNYNFTLYALAPEGSGANANEQTFEVVDAETFSGSAVPGIQTLSVSGFFVTSGDLLGFGGIGPYYPQNPNDTANSDATYMDADGLNPFAATPPGGPGTFFTVGLNGDPNANYDYISDYFGNQGRDYGIGVDVTSSTVPESNPTLLLALPMVLALALMKRLGIFKYVPAR